MVEKSNFTLIKGGSECGRIMPFQRLVSTGFRKNEDGQEIEVKTITVVVDCGQRQCDFYGGSNVPLQSSGGVQAAVEVREKVDAGCWLNPNKKGLPRSMRTY